MAMATTLFNEGLINVCQKDIKNWIVLNR